MRASALGLTLTSILLFSPLAYLGTRLRHLPPLLVAGIALCVGGMCSVARCRSWRVPLPTFGIGVAGIFGYHALYFAAFRSAPAVEVNLINYLWPLFIVVLSPVFLRGYPVRWHHLLAATLGLSGAGIIVTGGGHVRLDAAALPGYACAAAAALVWSSYSLIIKRLPPFPTEAVGGFCIASGLMSLALYGWEGASRGALALPAGTDWIFLVLAGLGPMGLAFFTWSAAMKAGDPRVVGALAYLTPLLSTLWLIALGGRALTATTALAMVLIVGGAALGSLTGGSTSRPARAQPSNATTVDPLRHR